MRYTRAHYLVLGLNLAYLIPFTALFVGQGNYEFLGYVAQVVVLGMLIIATLNRTGFPIWLLGLLSVWSFLHMAGGGVVVGNEVLYRYVLIDLWRSGEDVILKFDQVLHFYGFFVATFVSYWLLVPQLRPGARVGVVAFIAAMAGMGFGALNEVVEFTAYALLPATGVGGYLNTALDLVANGLGAIVAAFVITFSGMVQKEPDNTELVNTAEVA